MRYLIDTHTLLWITTDDQKLSSLAREIYLVKEHEILISMASIWELAIKTSLNKISFEQSLDTFIQDHVFGNTIKVLGIEINHVLRVGTLPLHHPDPFDRLIISQALEEKISIIGNNSIFDLYGVDRKW